MKKALTPLRHSYTKIKKENSKRNQKREKIKNQKMPSTIMEVKPDFFALKDNASDLDPESWIRFPVGETTVDFRPDLDFDFAYCRSNSIDSMRLRQWPDSMWLDSMWLDATNSDSNLQAKLPYRIALESKQKIRTHTQSIVHILSLIRWILSLRIDAQILQIRHVQIVAILIAPHTARMHLLILHVVATAAASATITAATVSILLRIDHVVLVAHVLIP